MAPDGDVSGNEQVEPLAGTPSPPAFGNLDSELNDVVGGDQVGGLETARAGRRRLHRGPCERADVPAR